MNEKIIYDIKVGEVDKKFGFIDNFKLLLSNVLEKTINSESIMDYLDSISFPSTPKKGILDLIEYFESGENINFFIPWGFRYYSDNMEIKKDSLEYESLLDLRNKLVKLEELGLKLSINFMCADSYASQINNCDETKVRDYFKSFEENISTLFADFRYEVFNYSDLTKGAIFNEFQLDESKISNNQRSKLEKQSKTLGSSYRNYLKNRQFEGMYINAFLSNSIKISFASEMDDEFDGELASLYITPKKLQKPWAKIRS